MFSTHSTAIKFFTFLMVLFCIFFTGCGKNGSNGANSDLKITPLDFVNQYNTNLDNIAKDDGRNYDGLKIDPSDISGANGVLQTKDKSCIIGWAKNDENSPNMCYMKFNIKEGTKQTRSALKAAVLAASTGIGKNKAEAFFNDENMKKQRPTVKDNGVIFDMQKEEKGYYCLVADEKYYNSIAKLKCHEDGNKVYCLDTDNMLVGLGGWHIVDVCTMSTDMKTEFEKYKWTFLRDENVARYGVDDVNGTIRNGKVSDDALATAVYSTFKQNLYLARYVYRAQDNAKQTQKQSKQKTANNNNNNSSNEVYVGTYSNGSKAYLLANTFKMKDHRNFSVRIKAINNNGNVEYIDYTFTGNHGSDFWKNSQGYSGEVDFDKPTVETNIRKYSFEKVI